MESDEGEKTKDKSPVKKTKKVRIWPVQYFFSHEMIIVSNVLVSYQSSFKKRRDHCEMREASIIIAVSESLPLFE